MSDVTFTACFAQGAQAIKPQHDGETRLWLDGWIPTQLLEVLLGWWREDVTFEVVLRPDPARVIGGGV